MRGVPAVKTDARARGQIASRGCVERASVSQDLACLWEPPRLDSGERAQGAGVRHLAGRRFLKCQLAHRGETRRTKDDFSRAIRKGGGHRGLAVQQATVCQAACKLTARRRCCARG